MLCMCEYRPLEAGGKEPGHCGSCNPPKEACTLPTLPYVCVHVRTSICVAYYVLSLIPLGG